MKAFNLAFSNLLRPIVLFVAFYLSAFANAVFASERCDVVELADGLAFPWSIAELPNGDQLVTERDGKLRLIKDGLLMDSAISGVPEVLVKGQGGLFDVVLDPQFAENRIVYLSYAAGTLSSNRLTVARARLNESANNLLELAVIFQASPDKATPHHYGGRMAFMLDGSLLITSGEGFDYREKAQRLDNLLGKVVRISSDGSIPVDNPYVHDDKAMDAIYSYGHRNSQGIVVTQNGSVYSHEHGPQGGDELNKVTPATNYGWPAVTHGLDYSGAYVSPFNELPGMESAIHQWTPSIAVSGMAYYHGDVFPEWNGDLLVSALVGKSLTRIELKDNGVGALHTMCTELDVRLRDVKVGPTGVVYLLTDENPGRVLVLKAQASMHVE